MTITTYLHRGLIVALLALATMFWGCESADPLTADIPTPSEDSRQELTFLKLNNEAVSLNKQKKIRKFVKRRLGNTLTLAHGNASTSERNSYYAVSATAPFKIHRMVPASPENNQIVGQLLFKSKAIALNPIDGKLYYVATDPDKGVFKVAKWDPETNTHEVLPNGTWMQPADKLAFSPDGTLFAMTKQDTRAIYTIDAFGNWHWHSSYRQNFGARGDMAFGPDGFLYILKGSYHGRVHVIDVSEERHIRKVHFVKKMEGLFFGHNDKAYTCGENGELYHLDMHTGALRLLSNRQIDNLGDIAPVIARSELAYAKVSLQVLPNSIDQDKDIEIAFETTELTGGVAVVFQPHGTIFAPEAILNIEAHGVDLSNVDIDRINIFYDNQETGVWEPMERDNIIIDVENGTVKVVNAKLPHFSRYGIAAD